MSAKPLTVVPGISQLLNKGNLALLSQIGESTNFLVQGPSAQNPEGQIYRQLVSTPLPGCWWFL